MHELKNFVSSLSMEELLKLKPKLGLKVYSQLIFEDSINHHGTKINKKSQTVFKRENKNRPQEVSSKKGFVQFSHQPKLMKNNMPRDPRFEESSGKFNEKVFQQTYQFLNNYEVDERKKLFKILKKVKSEKKKKTIKSLIQKLDNQEKAQKAKLASQKRLNKLRQEKKQLLNKKDKVYITKSEIKKAELLDKFKELKKTSKLDKYLEKKRKKIASKDRKNLIKRLNK